MTEEELQAQREEQKARGEAPRYVYEYEGMSKEEIKKAQDEARAKGLKPVAEGDTTGGGEAAKTTEMPKLKSESEE